MASRLRSAFFVALAVSCAACAVRPARGPLDAAVRERAARLSWTPGRLARFVAGLPKTESHLHLDGALSPATIQKLARRQGYVPLMDLSFEEIERLSVVKTPRESLAQVLEVFNTIYPLLQSAEALEEIAYDYLAYAKGQNIRYAEIRFAPALQAGPSLSVEAAVAAVLAGLERGRKDFGVGSGVIVCLYRPLSRDRNEEMLQAAIKFRGRGVVAVDLAGDEAKFPLSLFEDFFERAKAAGLGTTAHAGEAPGSGDLETALRLGVDRIGHGGELARMPGLLRRVIERKIPIEVNLTSNIRTGAVAGYAEHPAAAWHRAGARLALSTDDPGVFGIDLNHEYGKLAEQLAPAELIAVALDGIESLFLPEGEKMYLRAESLAEIQRLLAEIEAP